jgi:N6-L-threonylcarbamoyladenine synthase|tara:strand:+ start:97 stop:1167 length:1071 start_codon:yes stop_codon:yes gene_type:complete
MNKKITILGIESSCDETAASIIQEENGKIKILSNIVSSQFDIHKEFGGVVPELAARAHVEKIDLITEKAISESKINLSDIDAVATTAGPGLIVCLTVGLNFGKTIAASLDKPFIAVNHLEGHAISPMLNTDLKFPYLLLLISGGHTQYLSVEDLGKYKRLGTTIDDALGEAYDKTAKIIGIEFPGGPKIEKYAEKGDKNKFELPKPILNKGGCNVSFAGLKTAILRVQSKIKTEQDKFDLAASFQKTIEEILVEKTKKAFEIYLSENKNLRKTFVVAGGVAANKGIKEKLLEVCEKNKFECLFPDISLCSDNAAMIALVGLEKYKKKIFNKLNYNVNPRWQLDETAKFLKGAGVKI